MRTRAPNSWTISKQMTNNIWPMRSMSAECTGSAYISGSRFFVHKYSVSNRAITSDMRTYKCQVNQTFVKEDNLELTAKKKKTTDSPMKRNGSWSHPSPWMTARNITSTGRVTKSRVIVTSFVLGGEIFLLWESRADVGVMERAAACSDVDRRDTRIEPTLPGNPAKMVI